MSPPEAEHPTAMLSNGTERQPAVSSPDGCSEETAGRSNTPDIAGDTGDEDYPEGGTEAWLVVVGAWCAMIPSMGLLNTLAVLEAWVSTNELPSMSPSTIGWIFSCYGFFLFFCGAQVGKSSEQSGVVMMRETLANRRTGPLFDAHDIRVLIVPGVVGIVASVMCMSVSTGELTASSSPSLPITVR